MKMTRRGFLGTGLACAAAAAAGQGGAPSGRELWPLPAAPRADAPDYWCTWDTQAALAMGRSGYRTEIPAFPGDQGRPGVRDHLNEDILFGARGLVNLYPGVRRYLSLVLDDGWDVPYAAHPWNKDLSVFSSLEPDPVRFPSLKGTPGQRLRALARRVEDAGWRGLGLWVACQGSGPDLYRAGREDARLVDQIKRKLAWCAEAGVTYWKVDWGARNRDPAFRALLTELKNEICPGLLVEHCRGFDNALNGRPGTKKMPDGSVDITGPNGRVYGNDLYAEVNRQAAEIMAVSDTFRTYDVTCPMTTATALDRAAWAVDIADRLGARAVVNIEDEAVAAVCLGLATGVMRSAPNRAYEKTSPRTTFNRLREIDRVLRWRQLSPAFGSDKGVRLRVSDETIAESWHFERGDTWWEAVFGRTLVQRAAARMTRGLPLPEVTGTAGEAPFVVASKNPITGAVSVGALPFLTVERKYHTPQADVALAAAVDVKTPLAVFGEMRSLAVDCARRFSAVLAQDVAGGEIHDISSACRWERGRLVLPGGLLAKIGREANGPGDLSSPGAWVKVVL